MKCYEIRLRDAGPEVPDRDIEKRVNYLASTVKIYGGHVYAYLYLGAAVTCLLPESELEHFRTYHDVIEIPR